MIEGVASPHCIIYGSIQKNTAQCLRSVHEASQHFPFPMVWQSFWTFVAGRGVSRPGLRHNPRYDWACGLDSEICAARFHCYYEFNLVVHVVRRRRVGKRFAWREDGVCRFHEAKMAVHASDRAPSRGRGPHSSCQCRTGGAPGRALSCLPLAAPLFVRAGKQYVPAVCFLVHGVAFEDSETAGKHEPKRREIYKRKIAQHSGSFGSPSKRSPRSD